MINGNDFLITIRLHLKSGSDCCLNTPHASALALTQLDKHGFVERKLNHLDRVADRCGWMNDTLQTREHVVPKSYTIFTRSSYCHLNNSDVDAILSSLAVIKIERQ